MSQDLETCMREILENLEKLSKPLQSAKSLLTHLIIRYNAENIPGPYMWAGRAKAGPRAGLGRGIPTLSKDIMIRRCFRHAARSDKIHDRQDTLKSLSAEPNKLSIIALDSVLK